MHYSCSCQVIFQRPTWDPLVFLIVSFKSRFQGKIKSKFSVCDAKSFIIWHLFNTPTSEPSSNLSTHNPWDALLIFNISQGFEWFKLFHISIPWHTFSFLLEHIIFTLPFLSLTYNHLFSKMQYKCYPSGLTETPRLSYLFLSYFLITLYTCVLIEHFKNE